MKVIVFAATGGVGRHVVRELLDQGHEVTAFVRDPAKLDAAGVTVVRGDITDAAAVAAAVQGQDAVISAAGHTKGSPRDLLGRFTAALVPAMEQAGVRRVVTVAGAAVVCPGDGPPTFTRRLMWTAMAVFAPGMLADMQVHTEALANGRTPWVVARPPRLTDGPRTGRWRAEPYLPLGLSAQISRADVAAFLVAQLASDTHVGKSPMVTGVP